ncbi:MAG: UDP-N-acetylmuramoyl-tripeptide--D-alanyl-D-alanine ligase [Ktedonobacteraceae bacterium]
MFTLNDILQGNQDIIHLQSSAPVNPEQIFPEAQHDNRMVGPGDLFVAIRGAHTDGHRFIANAARAGAGAALCMEPSPDVPPNFLQIVVPDSVQALDATARVRVCRQQHTTLIGITGSNGKTSAKEAAAAVLSRRAPTLKTYASYNTEIGYPITLLRLEEQHRYAVLEMGAQWVGELRWLCETIATPDWSLITNVGAAHLGYFGSQERVAEAKSELVQVLSAQGIAILNYDDENVRAMSAKTRARVLFYGLNEDAAVRASEIGGDTLRGRRFTLSYQSQKARVQLHLPGEHGAVIALAAAAVGCAAEMSLDEIIPALESLAPAKGRGEIKPGPNGSTLIDDTYNANRQSILAITAAIRGAPIATGGKRWAVLGDILELGQYAPDEHRLSGAALVGTFDYLIAVGDEARYYVEGAIQAGMPKANISYFAADIENDQAMNVAKQEATALLNEKVKENDLVLIKGSRGIKMETMLGLLELH